MIGDVREIVREELSPIKVEMSELRNGLDWVRTQLDKLVNLKKIHPGGSHMGV